MLNLMVAADQVRYRLNNFCQTFGITSTQYNVLRILRGVYPSGHSRNEIALRMLERAPDVTRLLDRLEKTDFLQRDRSEKDKRFTVNKITDKGLDLLGEMDSYIEQTENFIGSEITQEECVKLSSICEKIYTTK
ncbi:MAG: MarR family transcriptional regulator [Pyrinomonadaceae bacterium]|nr:MarR family transcriptional regulator [Pyrinomonadaceae bacterium]